MQAAILNYNPKSNVAQQDDSDAALLLHLASTVVTVSRDKGVVATKLHSDALQALDCKPAAKITPVSVYDDDTPTVMMQDSVSISASHWGLSREALANKPHHDTDVIMEDSTAKTIVPTRRRHHHHQDNDMDEVMQASRDLQSLRTSEESLERKPDISTTTAKRKDAPKTQQGMHYYSRHQRREDFLTCLQAENPSHTFLFVHAPIIQ